jgi:hypothetical protein
MIPIWLATWHIAALCGGRLIPDPPASPVLTDRNTVFRPCPIFVWARSLWVTHAQIGCGCHTRKGKVQKKSGTEFHTGFLGRRLSSQIFFGFFGRAVSHPRPIWMGVAHSDRGRTKIWDRVMTCDFTTSSHIFVRPRLLWATPNQIGSPCCIN